MSTGRRGSGEKGLTTRYGSGTHSLSALGAITLYLWGYTVHVFFFNQHNHHLCNA